MGITTETTRRDEKSSKAGIVHLFFFKYNSASKRTTVLFLDNLIKSGSLKRETFKSMRRTKFMLVEIISFLERKLPLFSS